MDIDTINGALPIMPHALNGTDCDGCIVAQANQGTIELVCNECREILGRIDQHILISLLQVEAARPICPDCGQVNVIPGFTEIFAYICRHCGAAVKVRRSPAQ